jgi:putative tricarboxylic transport membrane protein
MVGSFALQNKTQNVLRMVVAGIVGVAVVKSGLSPAAMTLGQVLGDICENYLRRAVILDAGDYWAVFTRPLTLTLLLICLVITIAPIVLNIRKNRRAKQA